MNEAHALSHRVRRAVPHLRHWWQRGWLPRFWPLFDTCMMLARPRPIMAAPRSAVTKSFIILVILRVSRYAQGLPLGKVIGVDGALSSLTMIGIEPISGGLSRFACGFAGR